jgi:hypothetical protein
MKVPVQVILVLMIPVLILHLLQGRKVWIVRHETYDDLI